MKGKEIKGDKRVGGLEYIGGSKGLDGQREQCEIIIRLYERGEATVNKSGHLLNFIPSFLS